MDLRHYRPVGMGVTELAPDRCPDGHELGPGQVLIGCMPCLCAGQSHRIWMCVSCRLVLAWPGCSFHPEWTVWEGVEPTHEPKSTAPDSSAHRGSAQRKPAQRNPTQRGSTQRGSAGNPAHRNPADFDSKSDSNQETRSRSTGSWNGDPGDWFS